jgi:cbb3-type cytochrome oxidase subunit 3
VLQEHFHGNQWVWLSLIALVFFFVFFVAVLARVVFGMRDRRAVDELAALPFGGERPAAPSEERCNG